MSSILELNSSSDSEDDFDYIPPNEAESESEESSGAEDYDDEHSPNKKKMKLDRSLSKTEALVKEEKKKRDDQIWKSFLNSVEAISREEKNVVSSSDMCSTEDTKDVEKDTVVAKENGDPEQNKVSSSDEVCQTDLSKPVIPPNPELDTNKDNEVAIEPQNKPAVPVPSRSGLNSLLGKIASKDKKMTVLEKSLNDWKTFKAEEGIEKDLETYNKGKQGFLERQRFLERSDVRSYETEKTIRLGNRK